MEKNRIGINQFALLYLLLIAGGKFLTLPSILAADVGHDSWLAVAFSFLWDAIGITFLLWAIKINKDTQLDVSAILDNTVTKVVSKLILAVFFVIFVIRTNILLVSCYKMFAVTFDVSTNWIIFVMPVIALGVLSLKLGFNAVARASQLLFGLIFICVVILVISPVFQVELSSLLPIAEAGLGKVIATSFKRNFWFSDYIFIFFVFDSVKVKKKVFSPILTAFGIGAALTIAMNAVFVALYGSLASEFDLAMSKIGVYFVSNSSNGRWDWLTLSVWIMSVFFKIIVFFFCSYKCLEKIFEFNKNKINVVSVGVISLLYMLPMLVSSDAVLSAVAVYALIPFSIAQYALPIAFPFLTKAAQKKLNLVSRKKEEQSV